MKSKFLAGCMALMFFSGANLFAADKPEVSFNGTEFTLAFVATQQTFVMNEYVVKGETVDTWSQLITIEAFPKVDSPIDMAQRVVGLAQKEGILATKPQLLVRPGTNKGDDIALFIILADRQRQVLEFNVQRYVKEPGATGVKAYIYGRRIAPAEGNPKPEEINTWVKALWEMKAPIYEKEPAN
jgi:hypothetical protein